MTEAVTLYIDYRSPYSYLVKDEAYALEDEYDVRVKWLPLRIDLEGAYGGTLEQRTPRDWSKVKYLYMDCRRLANRRGLTVRGTQKIYDPTLVSIGMLFAQKHGVFRRYHDGLLSLFWKREFDIEDAAQIKSALASAGAPAQDFDAFVEEGKRQLSEIQQAAEAQGVFGVPTFVYRGELFWGTDRVWMLKEALTPLAKKAEIA